MLMSTMSSLNISISISIRKELMLMLVSRLSSLAHKASYAYVYAYACVASEDQAYVLSVLHVNLWCRKKTKTDLMGLFNSRYIYNKQITA